MKSQLQFIIEKLKTDGFISRNYCLQNYITRLGARINDLKNMGWDIKGKRVDNDYYYEVVGSPLTKVEYRVPELDKTITLFK